MDKVLEKIYKAGLKFLVPLKAEETYSLIVNEAIKLVKADYGSILLEQKGDLKRVYSSIASLYQIKPRRRGFLYSVFKTRKPSILALKKFARIHPAIRRIGINSDLAVPLSYKNKSIGVLTIISKRKNYFTERDMNVLKLFAQMASLAIRKTQLYDETKKALDDRDLFISMAAHEFRTPITTISGYTQLLYTKLSGSNTAPSRWSQELLAETTRLTSLVNELLEINRIKTGELNYIFRINHLREIIKRVINNTHFTYPNHKIIFNDYLGKDDVVISDFDKLIQVVGNLLGNAAKFSPDGKEISLTLRQKTLYFIVTVKDQGIGIPKKDLRKIFEKFSKGTNHSREGIGLGLFLAKSIIEQHHGTIAINSIRGAGTTVEVKLPKVKHE